MNSTKKYKCEVTFKYYSTYGQRVRHSQRDTIPSSGLCIDQQ